MSVVEIPCQFWRKESNCSADCFVAQPISSSIKAKAEEVNNQIICASYMMVVTNIQVYARVERVVISRSKTTVMRNEGKNGSDVQVE